MSDLAIRTYADCDALDASLAEEVASRLRAAIEERGGASIALSGGSTPRGLLACLGGKELAWDRVTVTLVDERWVDDDHPDSNARMVRETLLRGAAARARFEPLYTGTAHPSEAVAGVEARLARLGAFDCLVLGMGADGHFASLFPGSEALMRGLDLQGDHAFIAVDPPAAPHPRMSMTLARIANTRHLVLHINGEAKRAVVQRASEERDPAALPIAAVLDLEAPRLEIHWCP
jgi:6-phosphogluconolactonase